MSAHVESERFANTEANVALVLGLIAVGVGVVPYLGILAVFPALLAILFGAAGRSVAARQRFRFGGGRATTSIVLGILGTLLAAGQAFGWRAAESSGPGPDVDSWYGEEIVDPSCLARDGQPICSDMAWFGGAEIHPVGYRDLVTPRIDRVDGHLRYSTVFTTSSTVTSLTDDFEFSFDPPPQFRPPSYERLPTDWHGPGRTLRYRVETDVARYKLSINLRPLPGERAQVSATLTTLEKVHATDLP